MNKNKILIKYNNLQTKEKVDKFKKIFKQHYNNIISFNLMKVELLNNKLIVNKENIYILENYFGEFDKLLDIMTKFKERINNLDILKDKEMYGKLFEELLLIDLLRLLYRIQVYSDIESEEDINYIDNIDPLILIYMDNIEEFKERQILSYLNNLDKINNLFDEVKHSFLNYYLNEGKSVFYEYLNNKKLKSYKKSLFSLVVFSGFKPNIDYQLNNLIIDNLSKIEKVYINNKKQKRKKIMQIFPNNFNNFQYISNIKIINIYDRDDMILYHLNENNFLDIFKSEDFSLFLRDNISIDNYSIVFVSICKENLNYKFNFNLPIEFNSKKIFTIRFLSIENLIFETKAKLYGLDVNKLSEFDLMKRELLKSNINTANKVIEKMVEKKLYFNIQELYKNSVFIFKGYNYREIIQLFKQQNIIISSGLNTTKQMVNTLDLRIIKFLNTLYDNSITYEIIKESFKNVRFKTMDRKFVMESFNYYEIKNFNFQATLEGDLTKVKLISEENINNNLILKDRNISNNHNDSVINKNLTHKSSILSSSNNSNNTKGRNYSTIENLSILKNEKENINISIKNKNDFIMEMYSSIVNDINLSKEEKQLKFETFWLDFQKYFKALDENIYKELPHSNLNIVNQVNKTLQLKYNNNIIKKKFPNIYLNLNKIELLLITLYLTVKLISIKQNNWTNICSMVGKKILYHLYSEEIYKNVQTNLAEVYANYKYYTFENYLEARSIKDFNLYSIKMGDFFLELFCQEPHIILEKQYGYDKNLDNSVNFEPNLKVTINSSYLNHLSENIFIDSASIPMICKPKLWDETQRGGYLLGDYNNNSIITGNTNHGHKMENKTILYDTINYLSGLEFSVNNELLEFLLSNDGQKILNLNKNLTTSEKIQINTNIKLAQIFKNESFYLPLKSDFRGRLYVNSFFLNYQGSDLSKALIQFSKGQRLSEEGLKYLYIFGANLYNFNSINKDNHQTRINWVKNNLDNIYKMDFNFLNKAENVWSFISFCLVMKNLKKDPNYEVKLAIYIDATCSGIQHIAGMIKDLEIAKSVNLIPQMAEDKVSDIYTKILDIVNKDIQELGNSKDSDFPNLKHLILTRNDIKSPVMTKTYNVTLIGMKNQLVLSLANRASSKKIELKNLNKNVYIESCLTKELIELDSKYIIKIAQIIENKIFHSFPFLEAVYNYFKKMCKLMNMLGLPVIWFTPSGLEITQNYYKFKEIKVAISFAGKSKKLVLKDWTKELDKRSQMGALIPNIVHSLDASHLMEVIKKIKAQKIDYILPIHDCFGTHPNDLAAVYDILKFEFINIYSNQEFLKSFHENILYVIKKNKFTTVKKNNRHYIKLRIKDKLIEIPEVPNSGELDLNQIKFSLYMFN
jgi:hypothetical protein